MTEAEAVTGQCPAQTRQLRTSHREQLHRDKHGAYMGNIRYWLKLWATPCQWDEFDFKFTQLSTVQQFSLETIVFIEAWLQKTDLHFYLSPRPVSRSNNQNIPEPSALRSPPDSRG